MRYYYSNKGKPEGPLQDKELDELFSRGLIRGTTPVIEEGGSVWSTYAALRPAACENPVRGTSETSAGDGAERNAGVSRSKEHPSGKREKTSRSSGASTVFGFVAKLLSVNEYIDRLLDRIFFLPSFVPTDRDGQIRMLGLLSGVSALIIWLTCIISAGAFASSGPASLLIGGLLGGAIYGFIIQYLVYQMSQYINVLLMGQPIFLSSVRCPRIIGFLALLISLLLLAMTVVHMTGEVVSALVDLCLLLPCLGMVYICFNAQKTVVTVSKEHVSPGREFNNNAKFLVRALLLSLHVLTPLLAALAALAATILALPSSETSFTVAGAMLTEVIAMVLIIVHMPLVIWLVLGLSSWLLDIYDAVTSRIK